MADPVVNFRGHLDVRFVLPVETDDHLVVAIGSCLLYAMTIGNVILVKGQRLGPRLLAHETAHASQWALAGLAGLGGQLAFAASYGGLLVIHGKCNHWDDWAGFENGGYKQCL